MKRASATCIQTSADDRCQATTSSVAMSEVGWMCRFAISTVYWYQNGSGFRSTWHPQLSTVVHHRIDGNGFKENDLETRGTCTRER